MLVLILWGSMILLPAAKVHGLKGSVEYLWEQKKKDNKRRNEFTQVYELILSRRLQPLYDASLKFEFRSETRDEGEDKEKTKLLPSLNTRMGNELMNLNLGWSMDTITEEKEDSITKEVQITSYTNERVYSGLAWRPKRLPHILIQFQEEESEKSGISRDETRISIDEDYTLTLGYLTFDHSFSQDRRDSDDWKTTTYDLLNIGSIRNRFSFLDNKLDIRTGFESRQGQDKQTDGDIRRTWKHNANLSMIGYPMTWMRPEYRTFWEENKESQSDGRDRDTSIGHHVSLFLNPNPYLPSTIGMDYNRSDQGEEAALREVTTYSLKMEPSLQGLIFDPNIPMYPINTSFLVSNSTEEIMGSRQNQTWSFLLTGATTIYQGMDLDLDMGFSRRKDFTNHSKRLEKRIDGHLNLNLLPSLKGSIRQKLEWIRSDFEGSLETKLIYRPVETFMLDAGNTLDYEDGESSYQFAFRWNPTSKVEFDFRYQSDTKDREEYFSGALDISMTDMIRLELEYEYPPKDQLAVF